MVSLASVLREYAATGTTYLDQSHSASPCLHSSKCTVSILQIAKITIKSVQGLLKPLTCKWQVHCHFMLMRSTVVSQITCEELTSPSGWCVIKCISALNNSHKIPNSGYFSPVQIELSRFGDGFEWCVCALSL